MGEVCTNGSSDIVISKTSIGIGDYPLYGASGYIGNVAFFHNEQPYLGIVKDGSGVGRIDKYPAKSSLVGTMQYIHPKDGTNIDFLKYLIISLNLSKFAIGAAIPHIYFKTYKKETISFPPLSTQTAIAAELDAVQKIIDGTKAQLADLDALARSLFIDMFGDPVANEKGWEVDCFGNLFSLKSGDCLSAKDMVKGDIPVYGGNGINGYHNCFNKNGEYILIGRVGAYCGNVRYVNGKIWLTDNAFELVQKTDRFNNIFLTRVLTLLNLGSYAHKAAQPVISNIKLKEIIVPLPPLDLQQQFAKRVEEIERQKQLVRAQMDDARMLMAERMQYYFS